MTIRTIETDHLRLVSPDARCLEDLLDGEDAAAGDALGMAVPDGIGAASEALLRIRLADLRSAPITQPWLLRIVGERGPERRMVGFAGFHGPPDGLGRVEVGYEILPEFRGRGYAIEATRALLHWARVHGAIRFLAAIASGNDPSIGVAARLGFAAVGSRWDALNGTELLYELAADRLVDEGGKMGRPRGERDA